MIKSNIFWLITCLITCIISVFFKGLFNIWYLIPIFYIGALLIVQLFTFIISDGDYRLIQINKVKKVKHPKSDKYYFTITKDNLVTLYRSHLGYSKYINYFYIQKKEANIQKFKDDLNIYIQKDLPISAEFSDFYNEIDNWSGALSDELERDSKIKDILN